MKKLAWASQVEARDENRRSENSKKSQTCKLNAPGEDAAPIYSRGEHRGRKRPLHARRTNHHLITLWFLYLESFLLSANNIVHGMYRGLVHCDGRWGLCDRPMCLMCPATNCTRTTPCSSTDCNWDDRMKILSTIAEVPGDVPAA